MSGLKLYFAEGSPPARACMMLAKTLKLDIEIITLNLGAGDQHKPEFLKLNPRHQVPVLVDGDFVLTESRAILGYLVSKFQPEGTFYPSEPRVRAIIDQQLYYDATVVFESGANIIRSVLYKQLKKIPEEMKSALYETLATLESTLSKSAWVAGANATIADFSIVAMVTTAKELGADLSKYPKIADWHNRCEASFLGFELNVEGARNLAKRMFAVMDDKL